MSYQVLVIAEDGLPAAFGWALIEVDGFTVFAVKGSALGSQTIADGWAAYRALDRHHTPCRQMTAPPDGGRVPLQLLRA